MQTRIRQLLSVVVLAVWLPFFVRVVLGLGPESGRNLVCQFNRHLLNPFALWIVAHRRTYYGVLHHVGRRSGKAYATPVVAKLTSAGVVIPLPYGAHTDWCRNVLAAGGCTLTLEGEEYVLGSPEIVPASVAEPLVPAGNARVWRRVGIHSYLLLKVVPSDSSAPTAPVTTAAAAA